MHEAGVILKPSACLECTHCMVSWPCTTAPLAVRRLVSQQVAGEGARKGWTCRRMMLAPAAAASRTTFSALSCFTTQKKVYRIDTNISE